MIMLLKLLLDDISVVINVPSWTDIVQALAAAIAIPGAIAGFIVLFRRDREKEEQIRQLTAQTRELVSQTKLQERRIRLQFKPRIWANGGGYHASLRTLTIRIENRGPIAYIQTIRLLSGDEGVWLNNWEHEVRLVKDGHVTVPGTYTGQKRMEDIEFDAELLFRDEEYYNYRIVLQWRHGVARITDEQEL